MSPPNGGEPEVRVNAWTGGGAAPAGDFGPNWLQWALGEEAGLHKAIFLAPDAAPDLTVWSDRRVGWGVVLPDRPGLGSEALATGEDAPEPIRGLIAERKVALGRVPIFRPAPRNDPRALTFLRDLEANNAPAIDGSPIGVDRGSIPQYLLLCGSPEEISWELQYVLSTRRYVGRLDLDAAGLENYVEALLGGWGRSEADVHRTLTWAVVHPGNDITPLLRDEITSKLHRKLANDDDIGAGARFLDGRAISADAEVLIEALAENKPAFVATSSHGRTEPLDDPDAMAAQLGVLVGQDIESVDPDALLSRWQPDGAVWFCHACCSAGAKKDSSFAGLFDPAGDIGRVLEAAAATGDRTSPFPRKLLGAALPLRAFIGQVEPTFDWTLRQPETQQSLTASLVEPLYRQLFLAKPVGTALESWYGRAATLNQAWLEQRDELSGPGAGAPTKALLYPRLAAADVASTVLLGDPTAALPPL